MTRTASEYLRDYAVSRVRNWGATPEGDRDNTAFRLAGTLRSFVTEGGEALDRAEVENFVLGWNATLPDPLPERVIRAKVDSAWRDNGTPREPKIVRAPSPTRMNGTATRADLVPTGTNAHDDEPAPIRPIPFGEFRKMYPALRPVVIDGLLREGEVANLIAPSKSNKSWTAYDAALSIASGGRFLREYQCTQGRVLLIDNELHPETTSNRIPRVAETLGINPAVYEANLDIISLRGKGLTLPTLGPTIRAIKRGEYRFIILDAWYRFIPPGTSENENAAIMALYNQLDAYAESTGATLLVIHHSSKGNQGEKAVTDVGAGAGSQSRCADTHIVLRPHEQPGCVVLDAALRSFAPVEPIALMWDFPVWRRAFSLDVEDLKGRKSRGEEQQSKRDREGIEAIRDALGSGDGPMSTRAIRDETGMGLDRCNKLLAMLRSDGQITRTSTSGRGGAGHEYALKS